MSSYFQETSSSIAPSVASSAFNWQAIHHHHHQLQQQQMNLQPNADIFNTHYQNPYHNQGYHSHHQKYNNSNYVTPPSNTSQENVNFSPSSTSSSIPLSLNHHATALNQAQQYLNNSSTASSTSNNINNHIHSNNETTVHDESITTSITPPVATNNNVTNSSLDVPSSKLNYNSTPSHHTPTNSLASLPYKSNSITTSTEAPSTPLNTTLTTPPPSIMGSSNSTIQAAQTAAAAAAAVAAYSNPQSSGSVLDNNASDSYPSRMNLGFPYGSMQGMTGIVTGSGGLGDPNAAAMAAVHAAAASQGCYDMYAAASMASKGSSFYPWMKNYPGKIALNTCIFRVIIVAFL